MPKLIKLRESVLKYLVAAVLLAVPLYPKFPIISIPGTFVAIRLEDFLMVAIAIVLAAFVLSDIGSFFKDKINKAILLFLVAGLFSVASAVLITKTVTAHIAFLHWVRRIEYFIPFFLGVYALKSGRKNLEFYIKVLMVTILISFVYGFGQKNFSWPIITTQNQEYSQGVALRYVPGAHINAGFAGHYDLGTFLVLLLPLFIALFFLARNNLVRFSYLIIISAALWLLAFSGSRISTVSFLTAASLSLILVRRYKAIPLVILFSLIFFSLSPNLVARYSRIFEVVRGRLIEMKGTFSEPTSRLYSIKYVYAQVDSNGTPQRRVRASPTPTPVPVFEDRSTSIRLNVEWPRAIRALSKNPLFGTGYSSITLATDNDYLRLLGEVGILGFAAFSLIFLRVGKLIVKKLPLYENFQGIELAYMAGMIGGLLGIFMNAVFLDVFEASKFAIVVWLFLGMSVSLLRAK
ncbi:O-antigen ligase family protein [Patescibacteria group bacterium]|nr:O-antigen ligase family protein [Patescibacteria group bacterium]